MKPGKKNIPLSQSGKHVGKASPAKNTLPKYRPGKKQLNEGVSQMSVLNEPNPSYSIFSRIRPIGNSKGVILPNRVIEEAGISPDADLIIQVSDGVILIAEAKSPGSVNTNLLSWDEQFKNVIKMGIKPESDVWDGVRNRFDEEEWS
jgi:antitoxin component of MazEF toxin-antitoxin module